MTSPEILKYFFSFLREQSGLLLDEPKAYLIETRLDPLAAQEGFESIDALGRHMMRHPSPELSQKVVEMMTTHETSFFRDLSPFQFFQETVLPELIRSNAGTRRIRIWSAGCSTGQEPYSLAMILCQMEQALSGWDVRILATDISERILQRAREGVFSQLEVQRGLPIHLFTRFFTQTGASWSVNSEAKKLLEFRKVNVLHDFSGIGVFDVVFFRNVLIYFDQDTKREVFKKIARVLSADGVLFLGGAETPLGVNEEFIRMEAAKGSYYRKGPVSVGHGQSSALGHRI